MELLREWVIQIAGIIILSAICDIIMIEGDMKKYIKPIFAFVLLVSVIKPLIGFSYDKIEVNFSEAKQLEAEKLLEKVNDYESEAVERLYEEKIAEKLQEEVKKVFKNESRASVNAEKTESGAVEIKNVEITVFALNGEAINTKEIQRYLKQVFDVSCTVKSDNAEGK